jgi:hypothetical protein
MHNIKSETLAIFSGIKEHSCQVQWLPPVVLATWDAEIRRVMVQGQPGQIVGETLPQKKKKKNKKNPTHKKDW